MKHLRPGTLSNKSWNWLFRSATALLLTVLSARASHAQTHHVAAPERVTRAVAVYEYTGELEKPTAARLVPVSLFLNGHLEDAGFYLARPVPFTIESGDLYNIEVAGKLEGQFSLDHARKVVPTMDPAANQISVGMWYAYGKFAPPKPVEKAPVLQASRQTPVIVSSADPEGGKSDQPHFGGKASSGSTSANKPADTDKTSSGSGNSGSSSNSNGPQLNKTADTTSDSTGKEKSKDDDLDRPTLRKRDPAEDAQRRKAASQSGVTGPEFSLNEDPDRPTMRRGAAPGQTSTPELTGLPADMHQVAAVSDPTNREAHIFAREWESPTERADTLGKLEAIARPRIASYVAANQLTLGTPTQPAPVTSVTQPTTSPATPGTSPTADGSEAPPELKRGVPRAYQNPSAAKPAPIKPTAAQTRTSRSASGKPASGKAGKSTPTGVALTNEQLTPYTLSYGGLPTFVYTAQADLHTGGPVYITLVTQRLVSGELQVALSSITDATHLNRTPWLRPVDAVDPDASHRASLLFELRAQSSRQFALYRLISAQAEQTLVTGFAP